MQSAVICAAPRIWVLDSDQSFHFMYREIFKSFIVQIFASLEALKRAFVTTNDRPDVILSEFSSSDCDFLGYLKCKFDLQTIPVIAVSYAQDLEQILENQVNEVVDFIVKPFGPNELKVRVTRLIPSSDAHVSQIRQIVSIPLRVDVATLSVLIGNHDRVDLTMKEYMILSALLNAFDHKMHRRDLIQAIWGTAKINKKNLDVHISRLRKKLLFSGCQIKAVASGYYQLKHEDESITIAV